jgi:DNA primase
MPLRGRSVVIIPDNDKTGEEHAQDVAGRLWRLAASVRLVKLPRLPRKGDVSDWLDAGGTAENLETLSTTVAHWTPRPPTFQVSSDFSDLYDMALKLERLFVAPLSPMEKLFVVIVTWRRGILSQQTLATYLRVSPRRIRQLVADLKERGVLQVSRRGRRNNYSVQMHALS